MIKLDIEYILLLEDGAEIRCTQEVALALYNQLHNQFNKATITSCISQSNNSKHMTKQEVIESLLAKTVEITYYDSQVKQLTDEQDRCIIYLYLKTIELQDKIDALEKEVVRKVPISVNDVPILSGTTF